MRAREGGDTGPGRRYRAVPAACGRAADASRHCGTCAARSIGLCDALSGADLHRLAQAACWCYLPAGRVLMTEGKPSDYFFNISRGHAKLYKDLPDGRRQGIKFVAPGAFIGLGMGDCYSLACAAERNRKPA
jgi:CRP/FNR family transcriptional regulator